METKIADLDGNTFVRGEIVGPNRPVFIILAGEKDDEPFDLWYPLARAEELHRALGMHIEEAREWERNMEEADG